MTNRQSRTISRRGFLRLGLGASAAVAGAGLGANLLHSRDSLLRTQEQIARAATQTPRYHLVGTDGWIGLPNVPGLVSPYYPDPAAPTNLNTYIFGFANATGKLASNDVSMTTPLASTAIQSLKNQAQAAGPILYFDQSKDYTVRMGNLGLQQRPDLVDSHTIHWHGFRNAIPMFDGEPSSSIAVPIGRTFDYFYRPREAGTYMYHCHFEDTEHVHMGMTGALYVRPSQNGTPKTYGGKTFTKFAYNDGDGATGYNREFVMFMSEVWAEAHWDDAHIQLPDWSDYVPDFCLLNGRCYPDTIAPAGSRSDVTGVLTAPAGYPHLQYQPTSSLVTAMAGERVLLRFANLGYTQQSMTLPNIKMKVVAKDAGLLRNSDGTDISFLTNTLTIGPGESVDAIFEAPAYSGGASGYDTYLLYNRDYTRLSNAGGPGYGGQMTEIHVYPSSAALAPQLEPNT